MTVTVHRRTFDAKAMPSGSPQRATANLDSRTSEYCSSYRYGYNAVHALTGAGISLTFRTKTEATADAARSEALGYHD